MDDDSDRRSANPASPRQTARQAVTVQPPVATGLRKQRSRIPYAKFALVLAALGFIASAFGLGAIALGIVVLALHGQTRRAKQVAILSIVLGVVSVLVPVGSMLWNRHTVSKLRSAEVANRARCANNMRVIGQHLLAYAKTEGAFPRSIERFVIDGTLPSSVLACPSSRDTPASPEQITAAASAANERIRAPGHNSYLYLGRLVAILAPRDEVLLIEPPGRHSRIGGHVLWGDGRVTFESNESLDRIIDQRILR